MANIAKILEYKKPQHDKLVKLLKSKIQLSRSEMSHHHKYWDDADKRLRYFTHPDDIESKEESKIQIVIPLSFLSIMVKIGILQSIFFGNRPIHPLEGRGQEDVRPGKLMEQVIDAQLIHSNAYVVYYHWMQDALKFGPGITHLYWEETKEKIVRRKEMSILGVNVRMPRTVERVKSYEGNMIENVDPYCFLPDPRVTLKDMQKGEFCGMHKTILLSELKQLERESQLFNTRHVKPVISAWSNSTRNKPKNAGSAVMSEMGEVYNTESKGDYAGFTNLYIKIVPSDYKLTDSDDLETWQFMMTDNDVIISGDPYTFDHFPLNVLEPFPDGYSLTNPGEPAYLDKMEDFATWLITSRKENVKKAINDVIIYDPRAIDEKTLSFNKPGARIKLNPSFLNRGIDNVIKQFAVADVTVQHLQDIKFLLSIFEMITGVSSVMLGSVTQTGRKSATEIRGSTQLATLRVKTLAELFSAQGILPNVRMMVQNNQALLSEPMFLRIVGKAAAMSLGMQPGAHLTVAPEDIVGAFDLPPLDGTMPLDKQAMGNIWMQILSLVSGNELLMQEFDPLPIFKEMVQNLGVKNIEDFKRKKPDAMQNQELPPGNGNGKNYNFGISAVPDEQLEEQTRQGNYISLEEALG